MPACNTGSGGIPQREAVSSVSMLPLRFREARAEDISLLVSLEGACFPADSWGESALTGQLTEAGCVTLLAWSGDECIGYAMGRVICGEAELYRIAVLPAHRQGGGGSSLLSAFLCAVRAAGATQVFLEVRESNLPARALYRKGGFEEIARRRRYYRNPTEDALLLRL